MRSFSKTPFIFSAALLLAAPTAFGQTETRSISVEQLFPVITNVSFSTAEETYKIAYRLRVKNTGVNPVNSITFTGNTTAASTQNPATLLEWPASCTGSHQSTSTECPIGTLLPGQSVEFAVTFKSPQDATPSDPSDDWVDFSGSVAYAEGGNDNSNSIPNDFTDWSAEQVALGTESTSLIIGALTPSTDSQLFHTGKVTGSNKALVTSSGDELGVKVIVPKQGVYSSVTLDEEKFLAESNVQCQAQKNFKYCVAAQVTIPDVKFSNDGEDWLTITVQIDGSNLLPSFKANRVLIQYDDKISANLWNATKECPTYTNHAGQTVFRALTLSEGDSPTEFRPCLAYVQTFGSSKGKSMPTYIWTFLNRSNGGYAFF